MSGDSDSHLELPIARRLRRHKKGVEEVKEVGEFREWGNRKKYY